MGTVYTIGAVEINGVLIQEVVDHSFDPRIELFINRGGGHVDPSFVAAQKVVPLASITTHALKKILDITSVGVCALSAAGMNMYLSSMPHAGFRGGAGTHGKIHVPAGVIIPRKLSAQDTSEATIAADIIAVFDGTNAPYSLVTNASLPASSGIASQKYGLGPMGLGETEYDIRSIEFDFGIKELVIHYNGEPFARYVGGIEREPVITVGSNDLALNAAVGVYGGTRTDPYFYFRKLKEGGIPEADAETVHLKMTANECYARPGTMRSSSKKESDIQTLFNPTWDGVHEIVTLNSASAIG